MIAAVGTSLLTERFAYRPLRNAPRLAPLITAIGVSVFLQEFVRLFYGRIPGFPDAKRAIPFPQIDYVTGPAIQLGPITIQRAALFTMIALVICWGFLYVFVNRTQMGRAMQATSQDPDTSRLMGINVDRIIMVAFALGAALAAVAGLAWACATPTSTSGWASSPASRPSPQPCSAASATSMVLSSAGWSSGWSRAWQLSFPALLAARHGRTSGPSSY